jgi:2-polyprenyl-3-methyl-5-hydroxy-6-metoxy-1,4-benzoquinol methylase
MLTHNPAQEENKETITYLFIKSNKLQSALAQVHIERYEKARNWIRELHGLPKPRILDIACGTGYGSEILAEAGEVVGIDLDEETIRFADINKKNREITYMVGDAEDHSFLGTLGKFDCIVSLATIEHLDDHQKYLSWAREALIPGGHLIISFPYTFTLDWAAPHHKRDISKRAARQLFHHCGFTVQKDWFQKRRLKLRNILAEKATNNDLPIPPLYHWITYYLSHPHHFARRLFQMSIGGGILFTQQEYLLTPACE